MRLLWMLGAIVVAGGCFTPPSGIIAADQALSAAEDEGAQEYLPIEHLTTVEMLDKAKHELARQESEPITRRSYRRANRLLAKAEESAVKLRERTVRRKEEIRVMIVPEMQMLMVSADMLGELGPEKVDRVSAAIESAASAYREGRYLDALLTIRDAQSIADDLLESRAVPAST